MNMEEIHIFADRYLYDLHPVFSLPDSKYAQWDQRLFTLDPVTMSHVLQHTTIYEKPYPSRQLISGLIGVGMLSAEGQVHKRQRRVAIPAFSIQAMRALVPLVFRKGTVLTEKWMSIIKEAGVASGEGHVMDVCRWASRATFDVMGTAGK